MRLVGAESRDSRGQRGAPRVVDGVEQAAQREQVVGQRLDVAAAGAAHLEAPQRPGDPWRSRRLREQAEELAQLVLLRVRQRPRRSARDTARDRERVRAPGALVGARPGQRRERDAARLVEPECVEQPLEARLGLLDRQRVAAADVAFQDAEDVRAAVAPDGFRRRVPGLAGDERHARADLDAVGFDAHADKRDDHRGAHRVLVQAALEFVVDTLESVLRELEVARVLVELLEHRLERRLRIGRAADALDAQVGLGAGAERARGRLEGRQLGQRVPPRVDELRGERRVVVERRPAAVAAPRLLHQVERDLVAGAKLRRQVAGGVEREVTQRVMEPPIAHARNFAARRRCPSAPGASRARSTRRFAGAGRRARRSHRMSRPRGRPRREGSAGS